MKGKLILLGLLCLIQHTYGQQQKAFNQNASRSNHTRSSSEPDNKGFVFRLSGDGIKPMADSIAAAMVFMPGISADYYTGNFGVGLEFGGFSNSPHFNIADYTQHIRGFTTNNITATEWRSWFLLAGPSYRKGFGFKGESGYPLSLQASLRGGLMKMRPASFSITDKESGALIADYYSASKQSTAAENQLFALKPTLGIEWFPGGGAIGFNIHGSFLQAFGAKKITTYYRDLSRVKFDGLSQQEIRNQVLNATVIETQTKGPVSNFAVGAGISIRLGSSSKTISEKGPKRNADLANNPAYITTPRDAASGLPTGRRSYAVNNTANVTTPRDAASGLPTGKRSSTVNTANITTPRDAASGLPTGRRMTTATGNDGTVIDGQDAYALMNEQCGPVTQRITNTDGTTEEMTFACAGDAAAYNERISMNVTVPKQTQGATFGEKVNAGLHAAGSALAQGASRQGIVHRDLAARNIISGKLSWVSPGNDGSGIITNETASNSNRISMNVTVPKQTQGASFGERVQIGVREAATGKAAGLKKYGLLFADQGANKSSLGSVQSNPLYSSNAVSGNPLYEGQGMSGSNPLFEGYMSGSGDNPLFEANDQKVNALSGSTSPTDCDGSMAAVNILLIDEETEVIVASTKTAGCGDFFFANVPDGQYIIKVTAMVNRTNGYDMHTSIKTDVAGVVQKGEQELKLTLQTRPAGEATTGTPSWSTTKTLQMQYGDINDDGEPELLLGGVMPGGSVVSAAFRPGTPIGGIIVKGGKNPGGILRSTQTNNNGEFYFKALDAGDYNIILNQSIFLDDETLINLSNETPQYKGVNPLYESGNTGTQNPMHNPAALVAGEPIGGIVVKGGRNPGGSMRTAQTNERGEIEFKGLDAGDYIFTIAEPGETDGASLRSGGKRAYTAGHFSLDVDGKRTSALVAGQPIGGIIVKGGKNPGGSMRTAQTNEKGEVEFKGLDAGDYVFTIAEPGETDGASLRSGGKRAYTAGHFSLDVDGKRISNHLTSIQGGKTTVMALERSTEKLSDGTPVAVSRTISGTLFQNDQPLRNAVVEIKQASTGDYAKTLTDENGYYTVTAAHDTLHSVFVNGAAMGKIKIVSEKGITEKGVKRMVQNGTQTNPGVEALKSILIEADLDGDGVYETDVTDKVNGDIMLDENGKMIAAQPKAGISTSRSNVRTRGAIQYIGEGIYMSYSTAIINNKEVAIKNVLRTKHDTAKNSVSNIR